MAGYFVDNLLGYLKGIPADVVAAKRDLQYLLDPKNTADLPHNNVKAAFDKIIGTSNPADNAYHHAWASMPQKNAQLSGMIQAYHDMNNTASSPETVTFGASEPALFMHAAQKSATTKPNSKAPYRAMSVVAEKIHDRVEDNYRAEQHMNTAYLSNIGDTISMEAARGFSRLGDVDNCEKALRKHKINYGYPNDDFADFVAKQENTSENHTLLVSALRIENTINIPLAQKIAILNINEFDDALNTSLIHQMDQTVMDRKAAPEDVALAANTLVNYVRGENSQRTRSKKTAMSRIQQNRIFDRAVHFDSTATAIQQNYFDMMHAEIPKNNRIVLETLSNHESIAALVQDYNQFQYETADERNPVTLLDFIPECEKGVDAAHARNHLTDALIGKPIRHYDRHNNDLPSEYELNAMDMAIDLTWHVLTDSSIDANHPAKEKAMHTMSEILIAQDLKRTKTQECINETKVKIDTHSTEYQNHFNKTGDAVLARLSMAEKRVQELYDTEFSDIGQTILIRKDVQMRSFDTPTQAPKLSL